MMSSSLPSKKFTPNFRNDVSKFSIKNEKAVHCVHDASKYEYEKHTVHMKEKLRWLDVKSKEAEDGNLRGDSVFLNFLLFI